MALRGLGRMWVPESGMFCHCIRRGRGGDVVEGVSRRYTAIVLIGLATEPGEAASSIFGGGDCGRALQGLLGDVESVSNLGDVGLTLWAAALHGHPQASKALARFRELDPVRGAHPTVEVAWGLTALSVRPHVIGDETLAGRIAGRLIHSFNHQTGVSPHWPDGVPWPRFRGHVSCFADLVYPVQALAYHHRATGSVEAGEAARRAGAHMVASQGEHGQWWWHFDARSGRVVEGYPVYAVHQDSMAAMALFALQEACGVNCGDAIERGVGWLVSSPELGGGSLIDTDADLIWRKVGRHEPGKVVRGVQAAASRVHPSLRAPGMNLLFPSGRVDYECRPYHLGWILHAFEPRRLKGWAASRASR